MMDAISESTSIVQKEGNGFSPEEKEKIMEFRERMLPYLIRPEQDDENYLVKWLIARRFDVDKAEEMLKKHIRFIKVNGLESVADNYKPSEVVNYFYTAMLGYDKEGSVVRILHVGASDIRGLCLSISKLESLKYAIYLLLTDHFKQKQDRENDTLNDKQVYILDLQGLTWRTVIQRIVVDRAFMLLRNYEANHPERLKIAYIVNAPTFFSFIYSWLKTVLPNSIISKLEILSQDECQSKLTENIDPSILPAYLGGTRRDPDGDPTCQLLYLNPLGTPVPEKFLPTDQLETLKKDPEARRTIVEYKSIFIAEKVVEEPYSLLIWDFQTSDYDIRMGLRYKQNEESEPETIIPVHRVESHIIPESGNFTCENPGIYELVFDNGYSWMTSKELIFKVNLEPPRKDDIN